MADVRLAIPARSAYVGVVRLGLAFLARRAGLDEEKIDDLKIAVSEACANVVLGAEDDPEAASSSVEVSWTESEDSIVIEVSGIGLDEPAEDDNPMSRRAMSMALLRSLVDECAIVLDDDGASRTRLTLRRTEADQR